MMSDKSFLTEEDSREFAELISKNPWLSLNTIMNLKYLRSLRNMIEGKMKTKERLEKTIETYVLARGVVEELKEIESKYFRLSKRIRD